MAVFDYLDQYIETIKYNRVGSRGSYTPSEAKLYDAYRLASNQISQNYAKSHTPAEVTAFGRLHMQYFLSGDFYKDWYPRLVGQQATDTYKGAEAGLAATYQRSQDNIQRQMNQPQRGGLANDSVLDPMGIFAGAQKDMESDPKVRRCLELGGTVDECQGSSIRGIGKAAEIAVSNMIGVSADTTEPLNGVILVGSYHSRTDLPELALTWDGKAFLQKCGTLIGDKHTYTLRKSGATTQIIVDDEPDPIVLTVRPDGSLSGPGSISVKGQVISGYQTRSSCPVGVAAMNCQAPTSVPVYSPSMQRCTISQLAPQPAPPPPAKQAGLAGAISDMISPGTPLATIYGFRVSGPYASSTGMQLSFDNRYVTLDCGQAHVNAPYTVDDAATGFIVHVQNGGGAFLLAVAPDNTLRGSGSTTVNGRLVAAFHDDNVSFTPHAQTCSLGTFAPKAKQNTMRASNGPVPTIPASYPTSAPAPLPSAAPTPVAAAPTVASPSRGGVPSPSNGPRAQFRILLSSNFTGANPLAGQAVFVERKPIDQILREIGLSVPANATPGQAMAALQTVCHSAEACAPIAQKLATYYVTTAKLDTTGKATLNATAATGQYYFFAMIPTNGGALVWDVPANIAAGDNTVTFTQANAARVQ